MTSSYLKSKQFDCPRNPRHLNIHAVALSPDGEVLAISARDGVRLRDASTGRHLCWFPGGGAIAFSADGKSVAWTEDNAILVRDLRAALALNTPEPAPTFSDPLDALLEAELTVRPETTTLDLGGRTLQEYREAIMKGSLPERPKLEIVLEIRNRSNRAMKIYTDGWLDLDFVAGNGAVNLDWPVQTGVGTPPDGMAPERRKPVTLEPDESCSLVFKDAQFHLDQASYWLLPGEYDVFGEYHTSISPAPPGAHDGGDGFGGVTLRPIPARLKVRPAEK